MSIMNKPPNVLSIKDNFNICDLLEYNILGIKTFKEFHGLTGDQEIKSMLESIESMHKKHSQTLLKALKEFEN